METRLSYAYGALFWIGALGLPLAAGGSEPVTLQIPGGTVRGEVVRVSPSEVVLKDSEGKERAIPAAFLKPKEYYACRRQVLGAKDAQAHYDLGAYCLKNGMRPEGEELLALAASLEPAVFREKVQELLGQAAAPPPAKPVETPKQAEPPKPSPPENGKESASQGREGDDELVEIVINGRKYKVPKRFMAENQEIKPRTDAEMKKFLDDRLEELKQVVGGDWHCTETRHFFCLSNIPLSNPKFPEFCHKYFEQQNEEFYTTVAGVMQHRESDPLWNNKCPIYYFETREQFQKFAAQVDRAPGGANSGGYFNHKGREVHVAIPFYSNLDEKKRVREALNTLHHEGTHAFVQLVGSNARINSWLHEGMAQFMEFFYDPKNNPGRNDRVNILRDLLRRGEVLNWEEGRMRPMGGTDRVGYAFAWSRVEFLYRAFPDKTGLPRMIKAIKSGKSDEEAMESVFGKKVAELESVWGDWLRSASKNNFLP